MVGSEGFRDIELGEIQELTDTTPEELAEEDAMEMSVSKQVPKEGRKCRDGSAGKESYTLHNVAEELRLLRSALAFFKCGPFHTIWALKRKQTVEEELVLYRNIYREIKKQKNHIEVTMSSIKLH